VPKAEHGLPTDTMGRYADTTVSQPVTEAAHPGRGYARRPMRKISGSEAFKALMCALFNIPPFPPVGTPLSLRAPPEPIKGERALEHKLGSSQPHRQHTVDVGFYAPSA
jgi:hypothetical protein